MVYKVVNFVMHAVRDMIKTSVDKHIMTKLKEMNDQGDIKMVVMKRAFCWLAMNRIQPMLRHVLTLAERTMITLVKLIEKDEMTVHRRTVYLMQWVPTCEFILLDQIGRACRIGATATEAEGNGDLPVDLPQYLKGEVYSGLDLNARIFPKFKKDFLVLPHEKSTAILCYSIIENLKQAACAKEHDLNGMSWEIVFLYIQEAWSGEFLPHVFEQVIVSCHRNLIRPSLADCIRLAETICPHYHEGLVHESGDMANQLRIFKEEGEVTPTGKLKMATRTKLL
jgi:hypothetical protein